MQNGEQLIYLLKRGAVGVEEKKELLPASLNYAVPINHDTNSQRLQCSGRVVKRIEIIFPIRINRPVPSAEVHGVDGNSYYQQVDFEGQFTNPSRGIFFADVDILLNKVEMTFLITRDCNIVLHMGD